MNLPSKEECYRLLKEYHVPKNVVAHNEGVVKVAVFLAKKLIEKGIDVNVDLVEKASLLHDLLRLCDMHKFEKKHFKKFGCDVSDKEYEEMMKVRKRFKGQHHADACFDILKEKYSELALVIKRHRYTYILSEENRPMTWEDKLVYYADKRVKHDKIVSLDHRLDDGEKRNIHMVDKDKKRRDKAREKNFELEKEIFNILGISPESLNSL